MLSDAECKNATCPADKKRLRLTDERGLYLEVSPGGSKRWFWKTYRDSKESRLALGSYPAVSLAAARKVRDAAKVQKATGIDPVQARKLEKLKGKVAGDSTFACTAREWLELHREEWSPTHYVREKRNLEKDLIPFLGERNIGDIQPIELLAAIKRVEERGVTDVPHRVLITARGVWQYAVATGRAERDVTGDIKKALKKHIRANRPAITDPAEFAELLRASLAYRGGPVMRVALRMAAILFQRPLNLRTMRWEDLDLEKGLWSIPSLDMKRPLEQKLNGKPHVVPLPRQAVALLKELQPLTGKLEFVFPGLRNRRSPMSEGGVNAALHAMGYKGRHCWHGYRASGRTILRQILKYQVDVIETQLAHKGQITHGGAYDRSQHIEERDEMLQAWADYLDQLAAGTNVKQLKVA
jgi:integrase